MTRSRRTAFSNSLLARNAPLFGRVRSRAVVLSKNDMSLSREVVITNEQGLHARPSHMFVERASQYDCDVEVARDGYAVNGKSITLMITLGAECGARLTIHTKGPQAEEALSALCQLVEGGFDED